MTYIAPHTTNSDIASREATMHRAQMAAGVPIDKVAQDAGHVQVQTTQRYDRRTRAMDGAGCHTMASFIAEVER